MTVNLGSPNYPDALSVAKQLLIGGRFITPNYSALSHAAVGTGAQQTTANQIFLQTGTTASSSETASVLVPHLASNSAQQHLWDMTKKWVISFGLTRAGSDAEAVCRVQFKQTSAIGALAAVGLGIRIDNLALVGEAYGSAGLSTVALATLSLSASYQIVIELDPGVAVYYYVGGTLAGTISGSTKAPNAAFAGNGNIVASDANGVSGGTDVQFSVGGCHIWRSI